MTPSVTGAPPQCFAGPAWAGTVDVGEPPRRPRSGRKQGPDPQHATAVMMLVDDDPQFCALTQRLLEDTGLRAEVVPDCAGALAALHAALTSATLPAFVVLDYNLPDGTAPSVLMAIRADPSLAHLPVLVVSQVPSATDEQAALAAGAQAYAGKPSRVGALRDLIVGFWHTHQATKPV